MATENKILDESYPAAEDLSDYQYHFVVLTTSGTVRLPDSAGETPIGILQNAPESGQAAVVREIGRSKLVANDAISIGTFVMPEYVGATDAGKADDATGNETKAVAFVLEASAAEDDLVSVLMLPVRPSGSYTAVELTLTDGQIIVGQAASTGSAVVPTGDVTITNAGVTAIGANKVLTAMISDNQITAAKISANQVTTAKISDASITSAKISDAQILTAAISDAQVTTAKISDNQITTAKISDAQVTDAKTAFPKLRVLTTTLTSALFTAAASEVAIDTGISIPLGAVVIHACVDTVTGFTGAGQALLTLGDGTDPDRYNTGTPSISLTASVVDMGDVSGIKTHTAAKSLVATLSCGTNVANLTTGSADVTIWYLQTEEL